MRRSDRFVVDLYPQAGGPKNAPFDPAEEEVAEFAQHRQLGVGDGSTRGGDGEAPAPGLLDRDDPHHPRSFVDAADVAILPGHRELTDKGLARRQRLRLKRLRTGR